MEPTIEFSVFVGGLSYEVTSEELTKFIVERGYTSCVTSTVIKDAEMRSRGYGFIRFSNATEGRKCLAECNGISFRGRTLRMSDSHARDSGGGGGTAGVGGGASGGGVRQQQIPAPRFFMPQGMQNMFPGAGWPTTAPMGMGGMMHPMSHWGAMPTAYHPFMGMGGGGMGVPSSLPPHNILPPYAPPPIRLRVKLHFLWAA